MSSSSTIIIPRERIEQAILYIRGQKVILDQDLAALYGIPTKRLNEQMKRNRERFPVDFVFQLSKVENDVLKSHFATARWGGRRSMPYVYTEYGALMAANILKSKTAISVSVQIVRVFIQLRQMLESHKQLAEKLEKLERKYDGQFRIVFDAIRQLMEKPETPSHGRKIGFRLE